MPAKKTEKDWEDCLTPEQYNILRKKGTEIPFSGRYYKSKDNGMYHCAGCGAKLFSSEKKYNSGTGWPSFWDSEDNIELKEDNSHCMRRTEVVCKKCKGHLGHLFDDGPKAVKLSNGKPVPATGKRFCINSASLNFKKR